MKQFIIKISGILFLFLGNNVLFGMESSTLVNRLNSSQLLLKNESENRLLFDPQKIDQRLAKTIFFGSDKDLKKALERNAYDAYFHDNRLIGDAAKDLITYPNEKNNALKLLLLKLKKVNKQSYHGDTWRGNRYFQLLGMVSHSKKTFDLVCSIDPYCANSLFWKNPRTGNELTTLEHMVEDVRFNRKHIRILRDNSGMTTEEVNQMYLIDAILANLPRRDTVSMSYEEYAETINNIFNRQELPNDEF